MPLAEAKELLRQSGVVSRIVSSEQSKRRFTFKVRVELVNGWLMDYRDHIFPGGRRYSFHVLQDGHRVVRWDYAPHHPHVSTFPHHKHVGERVEESEEMDVAKVLLELEGMMQSP